MYAFSTIGSCTFVNTISSGLFSKLAAQLPVVSEERKGVGLSIVFVRGQREDVVMYSA
jgi:hypothetical protein